MEADLIAQLLGQEEQGLLDPSGTWSKRQLVPSVTRITYLSNIYFTSEDGPR